MSPDAEEMQNVWPSTNVTRPAEVCTGATEDRVSHGDDATFTVDCFQRCRYLDGTAAACATGAYLVEAPSVAAGLRRTPMNTMCAR
jgi:hypothetical protein